MTGGSVDSAIQLHEACPSNTIVHRSPRAASRRATSQSHHSGAAWQFIRRHPPPERQSSRYGAKDTLLIGQLPCAIRCGRCVIYHWPPHDISREFPDAEDTIAASVEAYAVRAQPRTSHRDGHFSAILQRLVQPIVGWQRSASTTWTLSLSKLLNGARRNSPEKDSGGFARRRARRSDAISLIDESQ